MSGPAARRPRRGIAGVLVLLVAALAAGLAAAASGGAAGPPVPPVLSVAGNRIVDARGEPVQLRGVNRSGSQYMCLSGTEVFDGPTDAAAVEAMLSWRITAVRVSLNAQCWLGVNGLPAHYPAEHYRAAVAEFVDRLAAAGLAVVLDLHWNAPGATVADGQQPMADRDHSPAFWRGVAATFASRRAVLFDLYNEPYPAPDDPDAAWRCVRDGGACPGVGFAAAGMQELLDAVRSTGARNPVLVAGPEWAGVVDRWREHRPVDPLDQLVASVHVYGPDGSPCWTRTCWDAAIGPLAREVPVVVGEMGSTDCTPGLLPELMAWADEHGVGYLAWGWVTGDCAAEPALIRTYGGDPTPYGAALRDHLAGRRTAGPAPTGPTGPTGRSPRPWPPAPSGRRCRARRAPRASPGTR